MTTDRRRPGKWPSSGGLTASAREVLKWAMAALMWRKHGHNETWPSYQSIYNSFRNVAGHMKNTAPPFTKSRLTTYIWRPADLPAPSFKAGYDDDDPPVEKFIEVHAFQGKHA
eukprot:8055134-Pyramimonas_sp.AAC.1